MLNREERGGLIWIGLFLVVLASVIVTLIVRADPSQPRLAQAHRTPLRIGGAAGRLVHARTGEPLGPAMAMVKSLDGTSGHWLDEPDPERPGTFQLRGLPAGGPYQLVLQVEGFETVTRPITVTAGRSAPLGDVPLRPLVRCGGHVVDEKGLPRTDAVVRITPLDDINEAREVRTDPGGAFGVTLVAGAVQLEATAPAARSRCPTRVDLWDPVASDGLRVELTPTFSVTGRVLGPDPPTRVRGDRSATEIQADGSFRLTEQVAGATWWLFDGDGAESTAVRVWLPRDGPLEMSLPETQTWPLELVGAEPGAVRVAALSNRENLVGEPMWVSRCQVETTNHSALTITLRPGTRSDLVVWHENGASAIQDLDLPSEGEAVVVTLIDTARPEGSTVGPVRVLDPDVGVVFEPSPTAFAWGQPLKGLLFNAPANPSYPPDRITGTVPPTPRDAAAPVVGTIQDSSGRPIPDARVSLLAGQGGGARLIAQVRTGATGKFLFDHPALPTPRSLVVEARDQALALHRIDPDALGPIDLMLAPGRELALQCVDETGQPLVDVAVRLTLSPAWPADPLAPFTTGARTRVTDADGMVRFRHLGEGNWTPEILYGWVPLEPQAYPASPPTEVEVVPLVLQPDVEDS